MNIIRIKLITCLVVLSVLFSDISGKNKLLQKNGNDKSFHGRRRRLQSVITSLLPQIRNVNPVTLNSPFQNQNISYVNADRALNTVSVQSTVPGANFSQGLAAPASPINFANSVQTTMYPRQVSQVQGWYTPQRQMAVAAPAPAPVAQPVVAAQPAPVVTQPVVAAPVPAAVPVQPAVAQPVVQAPVVAAPHPVVQTPVVAAPQPVVAAPQPVVQAPVVAAPQPAAQTSIANMAAALKIAGKLKDTSLKDKLKKKEHQINLLVQLQSKQVLRDVKKSPILAGAVTTAQPAVVAPAPAVTPAAPAVAAKPVVLAPPVKRNLDKGSPERQAAELTKKDLTELGRHFPGLDKIFQRRALSPKRAGKINYDISSLDQVRRAQKKTLKQAKKGLQIMPVRKMSKVNAALPQNARVFPAPSGNLVLMKSFNKSRRLSIARNKSKKLKS